MWGCCGRAGVAMPVTGSRTRHSDSSRGFAQGYLDLAAREPRRFRVLDATQTQQALLLQSLAILETL